MIWITEHLLIATGLMVVLAIGLVLIIFLWLTRIYPHESTRAQFGSGLVTVLAAALFSVVLNNWYAVKRDEDNRLRAIRVQHFGQLKPVLLAESANLAEIAKDMAKQGHITAVMSSETGKDPSILLWPDVISDDLGNHFSDYQASKRALVSEIKEQDQEFRTSLPLAAQDITAGDGLSSQWREIVPISFIETCIGKDQGMSLEITDSGYSFSYLGGRVGNFGGEQSNPPRPSSDQVIAFRAYRSLHPDPTVLGHCQSLRNGAETIQKKAEGLSRQAQLLAKGTILKGMCNFLKTNALSD